MLARIEAIPGVDEAWISPDGAFVVVLPRPAADVEGEIQALLKAERDEVFRLEGTNLATVLDLFEAERRDWIRGAADTKKLTRIEADIVGERIAGRVAAEVALPPRDRKTIAAVVADRFYRAVVLGEDALDPATLPASIRDLAPETRAALDAAVAKGFRPLDGER